jgi:signal transduction histidine kinase
VFRIEVIPQFLETQAIRHLIYFAILVVLAFALQPLGSRVQRQVDRWFYRERYDYLKALEQFSKETQSIIDRKQLSRAFVKLASPALRSSRCYLLLPCPLTGDFIDFTAEPPIEPAKPAPQFRLSSNSPFIQYLRENDGPVYHRDLDAIPQLQALSAQDRESLAQIEGELYIPLKSRGRLTGVLILGQKLSHQPYTREEEELLATTTNQIAINLENARLYELEREGRARLEALHEQRNQFILAMSHELKTPLTSIKLASEMLAEEAKLSPRSPSGRLLKNLRLSANSMERRMKDLLDFLKLQTASLDFEPAVEDVKAVLKDITGSIRPLISAKKQTLTTEIPNSLPRVTMDRQRFGQIVLNLLSNANRYAPTGGKIKLTAEVRDSELMVKVNDNGPGIPLEEQDLVFEPYHRVKQQSDRSLGLGLTIAKSLVELHSGKIWLDSQPGEGSTFSFTIPVEGAATTEKRTLLLNH